MPREGLYSIQDLRVLFKGLSSGTRVTRDGLQCQIRGYRGSQGAVLIIVFEW